MDPGAAVGQEHRQAARNRLLPVAAPAWHPATTAVPLAPASGPTRMMLCGAEAAPPPHSGPHGQPRGQRAGGRRQPSTSGLWKTAAAAGEQLAPGREGLPGRSGAGGPGGGGPARSRSAGEGARGRGPAQIGTVWAIEAPLSGGLWRARQPFRHGRKRRLEPDWPGGPRAGGRKRGREVSPLPRTDSGITLGCPAAPRPPRTPHRAAWLQCPQVGTIPGQGMPLGLAVPSGPRGSAWHPVSHGKDVPSCLASRGGRTHPTNPLGVTYGPRMPTLGGSICQGTGFRGRWDRQRNSLCAGQWPGSVLPRRGWG